VTTFVQVERLYRSQNTVLISFFSQLLGQNDYMFMVHGIPMLVLGDYVHAN
jgi:hypothetical protein